MSKPTIRTERIMAPYFVQMREAERRILRGALAAAEGDLGVAADLLGVTAMYVKARAKVLGGIYPDQPINEPPLSAEEAWKGVTHYRPKRKGIEHGDA